LENVAAREDFCCCPLPETLQPSYTWTTALTGRRILRAHDNQPTYSRGQSHNSQEGL